MQLSCTVLVREWGTRAGLWPPTLPQIPAHLSCRPLRVRVCSGTQQVLRQHKALNTEERHRQPPAVLFTFGFLPGFSFSFCRIQLVTQKSAKIQEAPTLMKFFTYMNGALPSGICPEVKMINFGKCLQPGSLW